MKALIVSADHFEDTELLFPYYRLREEGLEVDIASIARGKINGKHGYEVVVDKALRDVDPNEYEVLILPGGKAPSTKIAKWWWMAILSHPDNPPICPPSCVRLSGCWKGRHRERYTSLRRGGTCGANDACRRAVITICTGSRLLPAKPAAEGVVG